MDNTLYLANDQGVWYSYDNGKFWSILGTDLPSTVVNDLTLHLDTRKLAAATFGRSMYTILLGEPSTTRNIDNAIVTSKVFPNPASGSTTFELNLQKGSQVSVRCIDISGKIVRQFHNGHLPAGVNHIQCDTDGIAPGIYLLVANFKSQSISEKLVIAE
jgi:hypothetical protein